MEFMLSNNGIGAALDALLTEAERTSIGVTTAQRLAVIADEYLSNLVRHDPTLSDQSAFTLALEPVSGGGAVVITDTGQPFDPGGTVPESPRDIGGQGIRLMHGLASEMTYVSSGGRNRFRATVLSKRNPQPTVEG